MDDRVTDTVAEKLSPGTISSRRLLQGVSLIGFLVAIVPLTADSVSVFGIGLDIGQDVMKGLLTVVLIYLTTGFMVRVVVDLSAARSSPFEMRLKELILGQTQDIRQRTKDRLAGLLPSDPNQVFRSPSFESLLNDAVPPSSTYRMAMINNTIGEIFDWKVKKSDPDDPKRPFVQAQIEQEFNLVLNDLLEIHEASCRRRRLANAPRWMLYRVLIVMRFTFFDAMAPLSISILVIAILVGWIDSGWFLDFVRGMVE